MLTVQQVISASSIFTSSYTYDLADRILRITYPSGRWVNYARDVQGRVLTVTTRASGATTTTTLASAMTYEPFGALTSATWGNTHRFAQIFDAYDRRTERRWRASNNTTNIWAATYAYDNEDNITGITDLVTPANNQLFQYDPVERLTRVDLSTGTNRRDDYVFDANGNRIRVEHRATTTTATPTSTDTYTRTPGTNRLARIATIAGTRTESYDGRGNLSAESRPGSIAVTTAYDGFARLTAYTRTGQSALAMQYNGLDQRVMLTRGTGGTAVTRRMVQDRDGRLLGEYGTSATQIFTEYIWLLPETSDGAGSSWPSPTASGSGVFGGDDGTGGCTPLAVVTAPGNTTQTLLYLRSSHLGVPVGSTNATGTNTAIATGTTLLGFPAQFTISAPWTSRSRLM